MYVKKLVYNRILVALDGSEQSGKALDHAVAMAEMSGAELAMLTVVPEITAPIHEHPIGANEDVTELRERTWRTHREVLTEAEYRVRSDHPEIRIVKNIREGRPSALIAKEAEVLGVDLVVMGSSGIGGKGSELGGTCRRVVEFCSKPVLVVR
jgi:nucleotide-binding universal stress UspA family protein